MRSAQKYEQTSLYMSVNQKFWLQICTYSTHEPAEGVYICMCMCA